MPKSTTPTAVQRLDVQGLRSDGWTPQRIADAMEIPLAELEERFAKELQIGADREHLALRRLLRRQANKGNVVAIRELLRRGEVGGALDRFMATKPEKPPKPPRIGKKEAMLEAAAAADPPIRCPGAPSPTLGTRH